MTPSPEAWLVDLDGTLYHPTPVKVAMGLSLLRAPRMVATIREFRRQHEKIRAEGFHGNAPTPFERQVARTARARGVSERAVRAIVMRWMVREPCRWIRLFQRRGLLHEIQEFRKRGGKAAVVSDYPARHKLRALRAEGLFDVVVANGEPGGAPALKPCPMGYLAAAERLNVEPACCLVIGDRDDADGEAARRAGMGFRRVR